MSRSILVVDDDRRLLHVVSTYLTMSGYEVVTADGGEKAIQQATRTQPDLVVLDVMMPGMGGVEVCRRLRKDARTQSIPILMFSALNCDKDIEQARLAGANRYVDKPFSLMGLEAVIKESLSDRVAYAAA